MPDNLYLVATKTSGARSGDTISITIKDNIKPDYGQSYYTDILPKGYALENHKNKTYLKEEGFDIQKAKKQGELALVLSLLFLAVVSFIACVRKPK